MAVGLCHKNTPGCVYRLQSRNINDARVMGCAWGMSPLGCLSSLTEHENLLCDHGTQGMDVRVGKPRVVPGWGEQQPPVLYWEEGVEFPLLCLRQLETKLGIFMGCL